MVVIGEAGVGVGCGCVVGSNRGEFDLILGHDLVLGLCFGFTVQRRGKESEAATMEKDDDGEGSGVHVRGNEEAKPEVEL